MKKILFITVFVALNFFSVHSQTLHFTGSVNQNDTAIDTNGNIITVGAVSGNVDFYPNTNGFTHSTQHPGDVNAYITKISNAGNVLWAKVLKTEEVNNNPLEISTITHVAIDGNDNIYVAGRYKGIIHLDDSIVLNSNSVENYNSFIIKYDTNGAVLWHKEFLDYDTQQNGFADEYIHQIKVDNNKLYVGLTFKGNVDFGFESNNTSIISQSSNNGTLNDVVLIQYDLNGTENRIDRIEGVDVGFNSFDNVDLILVDFSISDTHTALLARSGSSRTLKIINLSDTGTLTDIQTLAVNTAYSSFFPTKIALDTDKNVFIAGRFKGSVDVNPDLTINNSLEASGSYSDIFILKLDENNKFLWVKQIPNLSAIYTQMLNDLKIVNGNPILFGNVRLRSFANYDLSGENTDATTIKGENGFFVSEFSNTTGAFSKAIFFKYYDTFGNIPGQNFGTDLEFFNNNLYISGPLLTNGTVDFLDKSLTLETNKFGSFITKFSIDNLGNTLSLDENDLFEKKQAVYQNNNRFITRNNQVSLEVYSILGKRLENRNLKPGIYLVKAVDKKLNAFKIFKRIIQ